MHDDHGQVFRTIPCTGFSARLRGWFARAPVVDALLLWPCASVHFWGTRVTLDVLFLDRRGSVLRHARRAPWERPLWVPGAWGVFEVLADRVPPDWHPTRLAWPARD